MRSLQAVFLFDGAQSFNSTPVATPSRPIRSKGSFLPLGSGQPNVDRKLTELISLKVGSTLLVGLSLKEQNPLRELGQ